MSRRLVDLSRLNPRQRAFVIAFRRGLTQGMAESRQLFREELQQNRLKYQRKLHGLLKELVVLQADFAALATEHHKRVLERAVEAAQAERALDPWRPLH